MCKDTVSRLGWTNWEGRLAGDGAGEVAGAGQKSLLDLPTKSEGSSTGALQSRLFMQEVAQTYLNLI